MLRMLPSASITWITLPIGQRRQTARRRLDAQYTCGRTASTRSLTSPPIEWIGGRRHGNPQSCVTLSTRTAILQAPVVWLWSA